MRAKTVHVHSHDKIHWCCCLLFKSIPLILCDGRPLRQARELEESVQYLDNISAKIFCSLMGNEDLD